MSASVSSPRSRRAIASRFWCGTNFGFRPSLTPRALARARPSPVRVRISSRPNSAKPPSTVNIRRLYGVVVSAYVSPSERKPACLPVMAFERIEKIAGRAPTGRAASPSARRRGRRVEHAEKLAPVGLRSGDLLSVDVPVSASGGAELVELGVERLPVGTDAGISDEAVFGISSGHILRQT